MARFTKKVVDILSDSGWNHRRRRDISNDLILLEKNGFGYSRYLTDFLKEFGELSTRHSNGHRLFEFEVLNMTKEECNRSSSTVGEQLFPVGLVKNASYVIFISGDGKVYATNGGVYLLGDSIDEGVEFICSRGLKEWGLEPL